MDKNIKYVVLVVVGGVGVYLIWKGGYFQQWFPSLFGTTPATPATKPSTPTTIPAPKNPPLPPPPPPPGQTGPTIGQQMIDPSGNTLQWNGSSWTVVKAAACPPGQVRQISDNPNAPLQPCVTPDKNFCDLNTAGWSYQNGKCLLTPPAVKQPPNITATITEQMVALAGTSTGFGIDEWCAIYGQVTGNDCPFDPGAIDSQVYYDAGIRAEDGTAGDRSTPTDIGTWLAMTNLQAPQLGLTGVHGLAALHVANAWLV